MSKLYDFLSALVGKVNAAVKVEAQTLTDDQKAQARTNIGAAPVVSEGGDTLTWDGNTEGLLSVNDETLYKVSDVVPTLADLANCTVVMDDGYGNNAESIDAEFADSGVGVLHFEIGYIVIVSEDGVGVEVPTLDGAIFPEKGIYLINIPGFFRVTSITIPGYTGFTTETLDPDYLPDHSHSWENIEDRPFYESETGGDTLTWDGNTDGLVNVADAFYKVSDVIPTIEDFAGGYLATRFYYDGNLEATVSNPNNIDTSVDGCITDLLSFAVISKENVDYMGIVFVEPGLYLAVGEANGKKSYVPSLTIPGYTGFPVLKTMEEKYLPEIPVEKLPGAVILYADAENYLYATEGTSDTSKRMTCAELRNLATSGSKIVIWTDFNSSGVSVMYFTPAAYQFMSGVGTAMVNMGSDILTYYTAEYTAS